MVGLFSYPKRHLKKLVKNGDYKEAIAFGESIEKKFSQDSDYYFIMGSIYYILEDASNALSYFEKALSLNPNDAETLLLKANVHAFLKEAEQVKDCCKKILEIDPDNAEAKNILKNLEK
ncbi:MAG TPA: tetratricopeptide repeat protein [Nitrosopumilaceae archaeon]|nr:tetratricopeptide repeat protein [Nitrosopumilaceae archaeon]